MPIHLVSFEDHLEDGTTSDTNDLAWCCSAVCMFAVLRTVGVDSNSASSAENNYVSISGHAGSITTGPYYYTDGSQVPNRYHGISWGGYPCGSETDYDVYCASCEILLWQGIGDAQ